MSTGELAGAHLTELLGRATRRVDGDVWDGEIAEEEHRHDEGREERRAVGRLDEVLGRAQQGQPQREPDESAQQGTRKLNDASCHMNR